MKLSDLKEMAAKHPEGYDITTKQWVSQCSELSSSVNLKQINRNKFIKVFPKEGYRVYSLWQDNEIVSFVSMNEMNINGETYNNLLFIASNPSKNKMGFATELIWELHLTLDRDIYIDGAFSTKGEKMVAGLARQYELSRSSKPLMMNKSTGEKLPYDHSLLMSKTKLGLLLEDCCFFEAYKEIRSKRWWLNDGVSFCD